MRISDWSSDVCSSDLPRDWRACSSSNAPQPCHSRSRRRIRCRFTEADRICHHSDRSIASIRGAFLTDVWLTIRPAFSLQDRAMFLMPRPTVTSLKRNKSLIRAQRLPVRSEEHTSELQYLKRISNTLSSLN